MVILKTGKGKGIMDVFEKLKSGEPVDMHSEEYRPCVTELYRASKALHHLNGAEPQSEERNEAMKELFDGNVPAGLSVFTPVQIDFPKQMTFGEHVFINHSFTAMAIGGITIGNNVQIGPNVTIVTDSHDFHDRYVLRCRSVVIEDNAWIGANAAIMPGVTVGKNAIVAGGAVVTKNVPANTIVGGNPAKVIKEIPEE